MISIRMPRILTWLGWALIAAWVVWLLLQVYLAVAVDAYVPRQWLWPLPVIGIVLLLARGLFSGRVLVRLHRAGHADTGTIQRMKYRGSWGRGSGDNSTPFHWFDLWWHVVPATGAPFETFTTQAMPLTQKDRLAEGLTMPVVYDRESGVTVIVDNGSPTDFSPGSTFRGLRRMRRGRRAAR